MTQIEIAAAGDRPQDRSVPNAMLRGAMCRCPACGQGKLFGRYLKVTPNCAACGAAMHHEQAHDAPPYVVMSIVGHVIVGAILTVEVAFHPEVWVHLAIWLPLTILLSLALLQPVKGALVGLQWALRMHGFGHGDDEPALPAAGAMRPPA